MAQYKCLPAYEYVRPGIYVQFNGYGDFVTNDEKLIAVLDAVSPFIERVDKPEEVEQHEDKTENPPVEPEEPKAPAKTRSKKSE